MNFIKKWHEAGILLNYGRDIIQDFISNQSILNHSPQILDIGCGGGADLLAIRKELEKEKKTASCFGIDYNEKNTTTCRNLGIHTQIVDLETEKLPFEDRYFDVSISNQVFEHLKNWTWALHEQARVTKKDGLIIVGMPNLAALHCRIQLILGKQPSCIHIDDAHVRGFTASEFSRFITQIPGLNLLEFRGSNLYGVPPKAAKLVTKVFPTIGVCIFFLIQKTENEVQVIDHIVEKKLETNYFLG